MSAHHVHDQPWLTAPETRAVISALEAAGGRDCARFVGGCVRNAVMDRPVDDIDIATILTPDRATAALQAAGLRTVPTGIEHGTVTAISGGQPFEVTSLRRDVATDGRRAVVAFTTDWSEDAQRRDFRFNALYATADGEIVDPTGGGLEDALAGRVVFVGDPMQRIAEDYLRILRYFRFLAWYARGEPDAAALAACQALKGSLAQRTAERTQKEVLKLLAAADPRPALALMQATGVLAVVLPVSRLGRLNRLIDLEQSQAWPIDPLLRLAALIDPGPLAARQSADGLRLSNLQRDRLLAMAPDASPLTPALEPAEARRLIHGLGATAFADQARLAWAGQADDRDAAAWRILLAMDWTPPTLPVRGADVLALGVQPGPALGEALSALETWWIGEDFRPGREAALERLAAIVEGLKP